MHHRARSLIRSLIPVVVLLLTAGGPWACATNPATGERQLSLIGTDQEVDMGRQAHQDVVQMMGLYDDESLQNYVDELGQEMAAASERPDLPWTFEVVDESMVNAFALPGGFIYMTRGILAHFDSESQLASVLGHEIGHVTARHSVNQMSRQQLATLGLGVGSIFSDRVAQFQGLISAGLQLAFLSFSRDDERESDELGLRYMVEAGHDPSEMPGVYRMLGRASGGEGGRVPEWLSTHPDPENREERIQNLVEELDVDPESRSANRAEYLRRLDGMIFGADPRTGYFRDAEFIHPELRFRFEFPSGWQMVNQARQVVGQPESGDAMIGLLLAEESSPDAARQAFLSQDGVQAAATDRREINGLPASWARFRVQTQEGNLAGLTAFVEHDGQVYQLMGYTSEERYGNYERAFESTLSSFAPVEDRSLLSVEPKRVDIVELPRSMTLAEFAEEYPSTIPLDRLTVINQVDEDERLEAGRLMKRVQGEGAPGQDR